MYMCRPQVMHMFKGCRREDTAPHIYAMAQTAYRSLLTTRQDQSVVLLGKSGSGKTTNAQHLVQYLVTIAGSPSRTFSGESGRSPRGAVRDGTTGDSRGVPPGSWRNPPNQAHSIRPLSSPCMIER